MARELFRYAMLHDCDQQDEVCMTLRTPAIDPHWAAHDTALHINPLDWRGAIDDFLRRGLGALLNLHSPDGLTFESAAPASLALPAEAPASMVHNLALYRTAYRDLSLLEAEVSSQSHVAFGGMTAFRQLTKSRVVPKAGSGILVSAASKLGGPWNGTRVIISGTHPGCVDWRSKTGFRLCEYDGRLSAARLHGRWLLYARANLQECVARGGRYVQVASSDDLKQWSPWRLIHIEGYNASWGDIYFFSVQSNPIEDEGTESLLAIFPLSQPPAACIGIAFSIDGIRWSSVGKLKDCALAPHGRTAEHPVARGIARKGAAIHVYMQTVVPGVYPRLRGSRLVRYSIPLNEFAAHSRRALQSLRNVANQADGQSATASGGKASDGCRQWAAAPPAERPTRCRTAVAESREAMREQRLPLTTPPPVTPSVGPGQGFDL
eukprot:2667979-Prymnesium_polylepis.1